MRMMLALLVLAALSVSAYAADCARHTDCTSCAEDMDCQWCKSNNRCYELGSSSDLCSGDAWAITSGSCPTAGGGGRGCCTVGFVVAALGLGIGLAAFRKA